MTEGIKELRLRIQCAAVKDHAKILRLKPEMGEESARMFGELLCGSSPFYIHPPQERSPIGLCRLCGAQLTYTIEIHEKR